jgi:hypothetical protein
MGDFDPYLVGASLEGSNSYSVYRKLGVDTIHRDPKTNVVVVGVSVDYGLNRYERVENVLEKRRLRRNKKRAA